MMPVPVGVGRALGRTDSAGLQAGDSGALLAGGGGPGPSCPLGHLVEALSPQSTEAHANSRDGRLAWTGNQEHLVSTGLNQVVAPL